MMYVQSFLHTHPTLHAHYVARNTRHTPPPIRPKAVKRITNLPWFLHAARPPSHRARLFSVQNEDAQTVRASNMQVTSISRLCRPFSMDENLIQKLHPGPSVTHGIRLLFFDCENQVPGRRRGLIKIMRTFRGANRDVALYRCVGFRLRRLRGEDVFTIESWINNMFNGCCIFLNEYFSSRLEVVILITSLMYISKLLIQEKIFFCFATRTLWPQHRCHNRCSIQLKDAYTHESMFKQK